MVKKYFPHIFIDQPSATTNYASPRSGGGQPKVPDRNRSRHGRFLEKKFKDLWKKASKENQQLQAVGWSGRQGIYVDFKSKAGFDLITKSLEDIRKGIRLLNIREVGEEEKIICATVYIPNDKVIHFLKKIDDYLKKETAKGNPRNKLLINSISDICLAVTESFWQDKIDLMPQGNELVKCEVWLRTSKNYSENFNNGNDFFSICSNLNITVFEDQKIYFPERLVVLVKANRDQLSKLIGHSDQIAEFRRAKETARFWLEQTNKEQTEWVENLKQRLSVDQNSNISVCVLDTGVNNGHKLIAPILSDKDRHTVRPDWGVDDQEGHGTLMSGLVIYGDLQEALENQGPVKILHKLESVKLIPKSG